MAPALLGALGVYVTRNLVLAAGRITPGRSDFATYWDAARAMLLGGGTANRSVWQTKSPSSSMARSGGTRLAWRPRAESSSTSSRVPSGEDMFRRKSMKPPGRIVRMSSRSSAATDSPATPSKKH